MTRRPLFWADFVVQAPHIAAVFVRRHRATSNLCMLATLRSDGHPRISPMEPRICQGHLVLVGMPGTLKFKDLGRDPRFALHTATIDPHAGEGDAKLWGEVRNQQDKDLHERFAQEVLEELGMDLRGQAFDPFYVADIAGASCLELADNRLAITIWKPGEGERTVHKS